MKPLLTVIIPCFNGARFIASATRSCLEQDVPTEVIVVDDGSTDDSVGLCREIVGANPDRVRVVLQGNQGPAAARNAGLPMANGQYLCFLDVDDEMVRGFLEPALRLFDSARSVVAVQGRILFLDSHRKVERWQQEVIESTMPGNLLLRTETVRQIGAFPLDDAFRGQLGGEDGAFRSELDRFGQVLRLDLPFIKHRLRPGGHADLFLDRAVLQDGRVGFRYLFPEEQDGSLTRAIIAYRREVADRMIRRLLENLTSQIAGVEEFQASEEATRQMPFDLHPAEGFALYELAKLWPARGGVVVLGGTAASAVCWLARGCRDSDRGKVSWIVVPQTSSQGQTVVQQSGVQSFVQVRPIGNEASAEPIRLLFMSAAAPDAAESISSKSWLSSLSRDGLAVLFDQSVKNSGPNPSADIERWQTALTVRRLSAFRKLTS